MAKGKGIRATRNMGAGIAKGFGTQPDGNIVSGFGGGGGYASNTQSAMKGFYDPGKSVKVNKKSTMGQSKKSKMPKY